MKAIFCLAAVCLALQAAGGADEVTAARYPDADTVLLDEVVRVRYAPDGTYAQTSESWTKLLTEKGRREEGALSLSYSKRYAEAGVDYVGVIGADGVERPVDVSATLKESTDNSSMAANIYDPLDREITCTIPGLRVGDTLHVKTHRRAFKARCEGEWADISVMEWTCPVLRSTYEVTAPAELPLRRIAVRHPLGNVITNVTHLADGSTVHLFTATNSPQAFPEPDMPPLYTQVQSVRVSTAADWAEISRWYWNLCVPHLTKTNAAMVAMVERLRGREAERGAAGSAAAQTLEPPAAQLMRSIFKFVSQEVRYMGLTMEDTSPGYAPHDVDVTFDNRYGVCRDKAGLLVAMLRLAGFNAFPVLIHVGAKLDPEVPQPFFNHAIVAVDQSGNSGDQADKQYILMDPTNENTKDLFPSYLCDSSYLVARPDGETLRTSPVPSPEANALDIVSRGTLSRDGSVFLESEIAFGGINDNAYRGTLVKRTPEDRVKTFERILRAASPGAELVRCEITPSDLRDTSAPLAVRLAARRPEAVRRGETRDELAAPSLGGALGIANWLLKGGTSLEHRRFSLRLDTTACIREHLDLDLGGALGAPLDLPDGERHVRGYDYVRTFAVTNGVLSMDRSLAIRDVELEPDAYLDVREAVKGVEAAERKRPVFAADPAREADVRRRLDAAWTTILSDDSWVTTNIDVTEVLTYKGKRDSAELKFNCHPGWKQVDLVYATVSNRDGRVYSVTPKEVNEMDCGWAASAPRYPAGKIKVVNLPSVEIGSVISVKTVVTVTNAPAPFYARCYLDSHQPVDRLVRRIGDFEYDSERVRRLPDEPFQPQGELWRDCRIITRGRWEAAAERLRTAADVEAVRHPELPEGLPRESIRNWMARYVKLAGPSLYELPLRLQLTDPATVLKERYATRLDYVRTLCALLRGAGYEADVVFAARDADDPPEVQRRRMEQDPDVRAFSTALCRVRVRTGGFLWFGGETAEYFLGTENEYTPPGATAYARCHYLDPESGRFGRVTVPSPELESGERTRLEYDIRANGSVDLTVERLISGDEVGAFRRMYAEMLPEERSRRYQAILGEIAQAASATRELVTDVRSYPARLAFSCYIPDFATVQDGAIAIQLPRFASSIPSLTGTARQPPSALPAADGSSEEAVVRSPEGYTEIESLPRTFGLGDGLGGEDPWLRCTVSHAVRDGRLEVTVRREVAPRRERWFEPTSHALVKDWGRIVDSRANRTLSVRRK